MSRSDAKISLFRHLLILKTRTDERGDHMKMNFDYFQIQTIRAEKVDEKIRSFV